MADIEIVLGVDNGAPVADKLSQFYPKVNRNFARVNEELADHGDMLETVSQAQGVAYDGEVTAADNVKQALDALKLTLDQAILGAGDSGPEVTAARYSTESGTTYPTLKDRLDAEYERAVTQLTDIEINAKHPPAPFVAAAANGVIDDSAAIQAVIDYVFGLGGGTVYLPRGIYKIGTTVQLRKNVNIRGAGITTTFFVNATSGVCFNYLGTVESEVVGAIYSDFTINGGSKVSEIGLRTMNASSWKMTDVNIEQQYLGININYGNHITLENVTITWSATHGLMLGGYTTGGIADTPYVDGLSVKNCAFNENRYQIEHTGSGSTATGVISGCHFYGYNSDIGIWLAGTKGFVIEGNWFESQDDVTRNIVLDYKSMDDTVRGTPMGTVIQGNCIVHGITCVEIREGRATVIAGNYFGEYSDAGVKITGNAPTSILSNWFENGSEDSLKYSLAYKDVVTISDPVNYTPSGGIKQQTAGTLSLLDVNPNGYIFASFVTPPADWSKVSVVATWNSSAVNYTEPPTQIGWKQEDSLTVRIMVAGKNTGKLSYILTEFY